MESMSADALPRTYAMFEPIYFEDLAVGQRASLMRTVRDGDLSPFGEDAAPHDGGAAKFGQPIAHGHFTAALVTTVLGTRLPGPGAVYLSQTVQFLNPVRPGDVVMANVEVVELVPARRRARLFCECVCNGRPVLEGEAWVALESRKAAFATDA